MEVPAQIEQNLESMGITRTVPVLLGVSGGMDSMTLLHCMHLSGFNLTVSHVNFQLRGEESDLDEELVRSWCEKRNVPCLIRRVDTKQYADQHHLNTQLAARKIRYDWWKTLCKEHDFHAVMTAHHHQDSIETALNNWMRGTGLKGFLGIPALRDKLIRPMIRIERNQIATYAAQHHIPFRHDASNDSTDYFRNCIRHHILPVMRQSVPGFENRMAHNFKRISTEWNAWEHTYMRWQETNVVQEEKGIAILFDIPEIAFALRWLEEYGFPWNLVYDYVSHDNTNGLPLQYGVWILSRTRNGVFLTRETTSDILTLDQPGDFQYEDVTFHVRYTHVQHPKTESTPSKQFFNTAITRFPLIIRPVLPGDIFQPIGMEGKSKKLQDFMTDAKMSWHDKRAVRVLANAEHILWVIGMRLDHRARVLNSNEEVLEISFSENSR